MKHPAGTHPASPSDQEMPPVDLQEQIRTRAYEIYELNGWRDGFAQDDWLQAETEISGSNTFKAAA